jgi:ribonucleoside-diphosphate reductase beta chain
LLTHGDNGNEATIAGTEERNTFKPFKYPWAYDAWLQHEQSHWLHTEVPMGEDLKDYQKKLTKSEKDFLTKILRFFVQGDLDIGDGYYTHYLPVFKQPEVRMMMSQVLLVVRLYM